MPAKPFTLTEISFHSTAISSIKAISNKYIGEVATWFIFGKLLQMLSQLMLQRLVSNDPGIRF